MRERLDEKHEGDRERRIEAIRRWVEYLEAEPLETWGPQRNAIVDGQLDAARSIETSDAHERRVKTMARGIREERDGTDEPSE